MKKILYMMITIFSVIIIFTGCGTPVLSIGNLGLDFNRIEVADGLTGNRILLDEESSKELYNTLKDIEFNKSKSSDGVTGWSYWIKFLNGDIQVDEIVINGSDTIDYKGFFYKDANSSIDMEYLASLFSVKFHAIIIDNENGLLVTPDKDSDAARSADKIYVGTNDTIFLNEDNKEISFEDLQIGDIIEITYNGIILESYPAQITADVIQHKETSPLN